MMIASVRFSVLRLMSTTRMRTMVPVVTTFPSFDYVSSHLVHNNESSSGCLLEFYHYHYHYHCYQNIDDGYDPDTVAVDAVAVAPSSAPASSSSSTIVKNSD